MTFIHKINNFLKKKTHFLQLVDLKVFRIQKLNPIILLTFFVVFSILFFITSNLINKKNQQNADNFKEITRSNEFLDFRSFLISKINSPYEEISYEIEKNDTLEKILKKFNIRSEDIKNVSVELKQKKLDNIRSGKKLSLIFKKLENGTNTIVNFVYPINNTTSVEVRKSHNKFLAKENILQLYKKEVVVKNVITNNLYSSATSSGMEPNIIIEFARIFGFEVDFQRDIRKGDKFQVMYERYLDDRNKQIKTGKILYAYLNVNNQKIKLYRFETKNDFDFYDEKGRSIRKALMKTPINGARLSSPFGNRKHPILGFTKHHNGTDFAAPTGTPIMASGNGTVIKAGWCGNGGNCVRIRHNSSYTTGYGHMSKIATRNGRRVRQGQIIGYVGNTGMSTGPHLHYTVSYNGKFVNSQKLKLPSGKTLSGDERKKFEIQRIKLDVTLGELLSRL